MFAPEFNPIAFSIGPVAVHWYGLMYLFGFAAFWLLGRTRAKEAWRQMSAADMEDLLFYGVIGVILGGRLGFCLFYQPEWYLSHPLDIFKVWQGGMSAHGGIIGSILAIFVFARIREKRFLVVADFVAPLVPLGLMFGRIGNFINGELWGRAASPDLPWAMIFKHSGTLVPRHPSQLYEAFLEGALLLLCFGFFPQAASNRRRRGALLHGLWTRAIHCRVFPRTRQLSRSWTVRSFPRTMAESAGDCAGGHCLDMGESTAASRDKSLK